MMPLIYMAVTRDELELPIAVADSPRELAKMTGLRPQSVRALLHRARRGAKTGYIEVSYEEDERIELER